MQGNYDCFKYAVLPFRKNKKKKGNAFQTTKHYGFQMDYMKRLMYYPHNCRFAHVLVMSMEFTECDKAKYISLIFFFILYSTNRFLFFATQNYLNIFNNYYMRLTRYCKKKIN